MKFSEKLRYQLFWVYDKITGGRVKEFYKNLKFGTEVPEKISTTNIQKDYLLKILTHSVLTVPFYKKYFAFTSIYDFPVVDKTLIRMNYEKFFSDRFNRKKLYSSITSGSTGAPFTIWQDKIKRARHTAENIYFSEVAGYRPGTRLYYLRVWNELNRKSIILSKLQNIVMQDASNLSDNNLETFLRRLEKDKSTKSILAFSSTLEAIALYIKKTSRKVNSGISCIISISETLPDGVREVLKKTFRCPVISRYSNMENGFIAQQCGHESGEYHINTSGFYVEMLHPDKDEPVIPGEMGRIVVTDLFNYAMPLIRYDTGDMGVLSENSVCGKPGPVLNKVEGRRVDFIYNTSGIRLSPHVITNTMWKYSNEIKQFQFIQNSKKEYILKLNKDVINFNREKELISDLTNFLGYDSEIKIEYVNEIPVLASGKRKKIINNFYSDNFNG